MPHSPIISKIRVNSPNRKSARVCNRNHLVYIGTREGVDLTDISLEKELNDDSAPNDVYMKYIHERPKSNGLFGNVDCSDIIKLSNFIADETAKGKNIYRGIISLEEKDAIELGYNQKENWIDLMNRIMPDIGKEFGIPITRLHWCAAVHMEKRHPHVHYMYWDEKDKVSSPFIHVSKQNKIREMISKEICKDEILQQTIDKTATRDLMLDLNRELLEDEIEFITQGNKDKIAGRIKNDELEKIGSGLIRLSNILPSNGRLAYKLLPSDIKKDVDKIVDEILTLPMMSKEYDNYVTAINSLSKSYSASDRHSNFTLDKNVEDLRKRIANQVLKACGKLRTLSSHADFCYQPDEELIKSFESDKEINEEPDINYTADWSNKYKSLIKELYDPKIKNIEKVIQGLKDEAQKGNVLAMNELGKIFSRGMKIDKNEILAQKYFTDAFKGFEKLAMLQSNKKDYFLYRLGKMYESGQGTVQDFEKAIECFKKSSENIFSKYSLASMYLRGKGIEITAENEPLYFEKAMELMCEAADEGNAFASYTYAKNIQNRNIMDISDVEIQHYYSKAIKSFDKMTENGENDFLLYRLGTMYYEGNGTKKDIKKAFEYFEKSAKMNNPNALYALGKFYSDKEMDIYDPVKAEKYFHSSIKEGNEFAKTSLAMLYADKESELYNVEKAIRLLEESIGTDNNSAMYQLGKIYLSEEYGYLDYKKAIDYLSRAASKGNDSAMYQLGRLYSNKESSFYNIKKAMDYLLSAAQKDNSYAMAKIGSIYLWGKHSPVIEKNENLGIKYLTKAIEKGNDFAQDQLNFYENYKHSISSSLSYSMIQGIHRMLSASSLPHNEEDIRRFARKSKEYKKVQAKLNKHGRDS